jgi:hypothetical protein
LSGSTIFGRLKKLSGQRLCCLDYERQTGCQLWLDQIILRYLNGLVGDAPEAGAGVGPKFDRE